MYKHVQGREAMGYLATRPTMVITTRHASGIVNAGVFGAYTNLSGTQVGIAVARGSHTYANIKARGEFAINIPGADLVGKIATLADDIPPERSEIAEAGLTEKAPVALDTPTIAECQAAVEFRFEREVEIGVHSFMIGAVAGGWIRESCLDDDGRINIFKARIFKDYKYPQALYVTPGEVLKG